MNKNVSFTLGLIIVLHFLLPAQSWGANGASRLDPRLQSIMNDRENGTAMERVAHLLEVSALPDDRIPCFIRVTDPGSIAALGIPAQTVAGSIVTARLTLDEIATLSTQNAVTSISMAVRAKPLLDLSIPATYTDEVHDGNGAIPPVYSGITGEGVIVGIIDTGIDPYHDDFWANGDSRILQIWDQDDNSGTSPSGFGYGTEWDTDDIENSDCDSKDTHGHGTHVAGTAAGNGAATGHGEPAYTYVGAAPKADIIAVKTTFFTTDVVDAVEYVFSKATALSKSAVVNLSLGTHYGPHDGTADFDLALDALAGENRIIVAAAGNEQGDRIHAEVTVAQGGTGSATFIIPNYVAKVASDNDIVAIDAWYTGDSELAVTLTSPNGHVAGPVPFGDSETYNTVDGFVTIDNATTNPVNGDENLYIEIRDAMSVNPPEQGTWILEFEGTVVPAGLLPAVAEIDLWLYVATIASSPYFNLSSQEQEIVGSPATADSVIAVAAWVTKKMWASIDGNSYQYLPAPVLNSIADFSSIGPRRDGVNKPDVAAPGMGIVAALSTYASYQVEYIDPDGKHFLNQGTSMACPHVAGIVALMLESNGSLTKGEIMAQLSNTANTDAFTGSVPNSTWGVGKIDALGATSWTTPVMIYGMEAQPEPWGVRVTWAVNSDITIEGYRIHRALDDGSYPDDLLNRALPIIEGLAAELDGSADDRGLTEPGRYAYWIEAIHDGKSAEMAGPVYVDWSPTATGRIVFHPASPNPFTPNTTIRLDLNYKTRVRVDILEPGGRRICTVANQMYQPGEVRIVWDGRDGTGRPMAPGLYFTWIRAGDQEQIGRLVLLR
ncbi:MAG: S8 family serine peptidase [Candidatus Eisenbacteria bacterium]|nr:S8 family serine peptidase [Candidatus Eisenbacteria bacterium]